MANKPREQIQRELDLIKGFQEKGFKDGEIIHQLQIEPRTYRRYKARIIKDFMKVWEQENKDSARIRYAQFSKTLEDCYNINLKIVNDPSSSNKDKQESSKIMVICKSQLARLSKDGPVFQPQLPVVEVDAKEITI